MTAEPKIPPMVPSAEERVDAIRYFGSITDGIIATIERAYRDGALAERAARENPTNEQIIAAANNLEPILQEARKAERARLIAALRESPEGVSWFLSAAADWLEKNDA